MKSAAFWIYYYYFMASSARVALFFGAIVAVSCLSNLVADRAPVDSFAPIYTAYTVSLLLLAGCALPPAPV